MGQHRIELASWRATEELLERAEIRRGEVKVIPRADPTGINAESYSSDKGNMNRIWTTDDDPSTQVARNLWGEIAADDLTDHLNETVGYEGKMRVARGNTQTGANPLLSHKVATGLDGEALLFESTREDTDLEHRVKLTLKFIIKVLRSISVKLELGDEGTPEPEPEPEPQLETIELPEDGQGQTGHSNICGVAIVPDRDLKALEVRLGGNRHDGVKDITAIHVYDDEQTPLATKQTAGLDHGDWVGIDYDFAEGQEYRILLDGEGEQYVRYRAEASCPYEGDGLTVINGSYSPGDNSQTENYVYNIDRIRGSLTEGIDEPEPDYRNVELSEVASDENASVADDPAGGERPVASIDCQEGKPQHYSVETRWELEDLVGHEPDVVHFRYQIYFPTHFEFHQSMNHGGTKMPGPADHRGEGAAGGSHNPGEAWSARGYATTRGPNDATEDESDIPLGKQVYDVTGASKDYGHMHSWKRGANKGEWVTIDERYEMGEPGEFDSRITAWVNGKKAFDHDDYQFVGEGHGHKGVHEWRWHFYFGGRWGSPKEQSKYVRRFGVWSGDNCPELEDLE